MDAATNALNAWLPAEVSAFETVAENIHDGFSMFDGIAGQPAQRQALGHCVELVDPGALLLTVTGCHTFRKDTTWTSRSILFLSFACRSAQRAST